VLLAAPYQNGKALLLNITTTTAQWNVEKKWWV